MGCDIHMFVEYKVGDGPWQADKNHKVIDDDGYTYLEQLPFSGRNYQLFGRLAGVRCDGPPAKGLPDDVSEIIRSNTDDEEEYGDDHSHSHSSFDELKQALTECGYDLSKRPKNVNWDTKVGYEERYLTLVSYIEERVEELRVAIEAEKFLLDQDINTTVEARVVYWFDN